MMWHKAYGGFGAKLDDIEKLKTRKYGKMKRQESGGIDNPE